MSNQWFRSWHGAPTDPKWLGIARKAGVAPGMVAALVWALLDRASQSSERGSIEGYDADGLGCFFGIEPEQVESIISAMREKGVLDGDKFNGWEKRQPVREDGSAERAKEWRERKKETPNATERNRTLDKDTDTEKKDIPARKALDRDQFEAFMVAYPKRVAKGAALKAWPKAILKTSPDTIVAAAKAFAAKQVGKDVEFIPHPATWLNAERWSDENLSQQASAKSCAPSFPIVKGTREWAAWQSVKKTPETDLRDEAGNLLGRGWYFPSKLPPGHEQVAA